MSVLKHQNRSPQYVSERTKCHLLLSLAGGIIIPPSLLIASVAASRMGYGKLGEALMWLMFWTWGTFGSLFDLILGTESYWLPNPLGLVGSLIFNVVSFSVLSYVLAWVVKEFRYAKRVDE